MRTQIKKCFMAVLAVAAVCGAFAQFAARDSAGVAVSNNQIKKILALAKTSAEEDFNVDFCGFFAGMSRYDAMDLAAFYRLKDGEYSFKTSGPGKAVGSLWFSLKGVRRITKGGNTIEELAQAVANRVENLKRNFDTHEWERKTIDGVVVIFGERGLIIQNNQLASKAPIATAEAARKDKADVDEKAARERAAKESWMKKGGGATKTLRLPGGATMEMIYVAPGSFTMGSPESEEDRGNDETQHRVTLTKGFWLGKYEVTQAQWKSVMGSNPAYFKGDNLPVENVSWNDCQEFIRKVNAEAERQFGGEARLPTEAEWEYACRAWATGAYAGADDLDFMGWYDGNSGYKTHPVGQKSPNAWGFYDMHGNVREWCNDSHGWYPGGSVTDPVGPASGRHRVLRGGSWYDYARRCRSANRDWNGPAYRFGSLPGDRDGHVGFRLCCSAGSRGQVAGETSKAENASLADKAEPVSATQSGVLRQGITKTLTLPGGAKMEMIYVAPGSFTMGSPETEEGRDNDETQHRVTLTKGFWLGKYEVTQKQWKSVMGDNPSDNKGDNRPVENVSWNDCQEFIRKVNAEAERQFGGEARLPTESEWEYACRAGSTGAYAGTGDLDSMGWYDGNSGYKTHPAGQKRPNAWGFYDMHGNVWEWCNDWYGEYPGGSVTDPAGAASGDDRVLRGGSWGDSARGCRSATRGGGLPGSRYRNIGFRLARSAGPRE